MINILSSHCPRLVPFFSFFFFYLKRGKVKFAWFTLELGTKTNTRKGSNQHSNNCTYTSNHIIILCVKIINFLIKFSTTFNLFVSPLSIVIHFQEIWPAAFQLFLCSMITLITHYIWPEKIETVTESNFICFNLSYQYFHGSEWVCKLSFCSLNISVLPIKI